MSSRTVFVNRWTKLAAIALVVAALMAPATSVFAASAQPRDKEANSIIWGGCYTKQECLDIINKGDGHHTSANLKQIYYQEGRGITEANFKSDTTVDGVVYKNGDVKVNGKIVARTAKSIGRDFKTGSVKSGSVWERSTQVSFASDSIPAFVSMEGGVFHYFIIKSCGNAGKATPTSTPSPSPVLTKSPTPSKSSTPSPIVETESPTPTGGGEVLGTTLPETGSAAALGGIAGLSAIGVATRAYLRSRKDLHASLRNKRK